MTPNIKAITFELTALCSKDETQILKSATSAKRTSTKEDV
ncbi:Hypothetical protein ADU71_1935 [Pediococcus damnosus]|nr:Hypothetical protein ADU71_1935 [Pediococcus damnosus]